MKQEAPLNFTSFCMNLSVPFIHESSISCFNFRFPYMTTQLLMLSFLPWGGGGEWERGQRAPPEAVPLGLLPP